MYTDINLDLSDIKRQSQEQQDAIAERAIGEIQAALRDAAHAGHSALVVQTIVGYPSRGRLSFDGNPKHLRGANRKIWDWLFTTGLSPQVLRDEAAPGDKPVPYYIVADWSGVYPSRSCDDTQNSMQANALRYQRDHAIERIALDVIKEIAQKIRVETAKGADWATVYSFYGSLNPDIFLPFDGKKENLSGVAKMVWDFLQTRGLSPRLFSEATPQVEIRGIGEADYGADGRTYHIAACWYDQDDEGNKG